jgi:hypothetical protein
MMTDAPVPDTGSAAEDLRLTLRGMMGFYSSRSGAMYAQLVGVSIPRWRWISFSGRGCTGWRLDTGD